MNDIIEQLDDGPGTIKAEILRLRALNAELVEALLVARQWMPVGEPYTEVGVSDVRIVDAAIAKAKEES